MADTEMLFMPDVESNYLREWDAKVIKRKKDYVVLDASATTLQAALFPHVLNEAGEVLYGPADLDQKALDRGDPVTYVGVV